jgi:hypothetical protein
MSQGWVKIMQRCGRYAYRPVWVHVTNPAHCNPSTDKEVDRK